MKQTTIELVDSPRPFAIEELFYSTTDHRGIITGCNDVFVRVSGFTECELIGQPHNIIRHPDMPRCVFQLLWDFLQSGRPIGAYVKNLAKTGEYYWVFAYAAPIEDGYLSIRLKPSSDFFDAIAPVYQELLQVEAEFGDEWREGMAAAGSQLMRTLRSLGFLEYEDFMQEGLRRELAARDAVMSTEQPSQSAGDLDFHPARLEEESLRALFHGVSEMAGMRARLREVEENLQRFSFSLKMLSLNTSVRSRRVGDEGRTLDVISQEVSRISDGLQENMGQLNQDVNDLQSKLGTACFSASAARLQGEMATSFAQRSSEKSGAMQELTLLTTVAGRAKECALENLQGLRSNIRGFRRFINDLTETITALDFAYISGRTEASRLTDGESFEVLLSELKTMTKQSIQNLSDLEATAVGVDRFLGEHAS